MRLLLVGAGGFIGSILRYLVSGWMQRLALGDSFPAGTLAVNVTGCLVMGVVAELADVRNVLSPETRALLVVGILGGYTTFSAFANESLNLFRDSEVALGSLNVLLTVVSCLVAVWAGRWLAHVIWG